MNIKEAANLLFDELSEKEGFSECKPHEGDLLVRYYKNTEVESAIPEKFNGYCVRKSPYQNAYEC